MFLMKETDNIGSTTIKADFLRKLEWLDLERETLASNTNQAEEMILGKEMDDIEDTMTKDDFFWELEQFDLERETR